MQWLGKIKGSSLIEVLIASSIFSVFVLQAIAHGLRSYCTVRDCLETTQEVITEGSRYRVEKKQHAGYSLIEVVLSLTLTLILTLGFIQSVIIINNIYVKHEALMKIQENARSIHAILHALYTQKDAMGCNRWGEDLNVVIEPGADLTINQKKLRHTPIMDSDIISINYASEKIVQKPGTIVVLSNCRQAEIFVLQEKDLPLCDDKDRKLSQYHSVILYVAKTDRIDEKGELIHALYSTELNGRTQERVEGVERIRLTQGLQSVKLEFLLTTQLLKQWWVWEF